jgi:hypothetical protein
MNRINRIGLWSAAASAIFSIAWFITFQLQDLIAPIGEWQQLQQYAAEFSPLRILLVYPSLLLPISFLALIACLHYSFPEKKRVWSLIALSLGILYAALASVNYNIQAVAVRISLAAGNISGTEMFLPDNPGSIFNALSNSYAYMALAMAAVGFAFEKGGLQGWVRWIFTAQLLTAVGQIGWTMFDLNTNVFIATSMLWVIGAPTAFILIAVLYARGDLKPAV